MSLRKVSVQRDWLRVEGVPLPHREKRLTRREVARLLLAEKSDNFLDLGDVLHTEFGLINPASLTAESGTFYLRLMCIRTDVLSAWYHNLLE
jgi:hypothetical protein